MWDFMHGEKHHRAYIVDKYRADLFLFIIPGGPKSSTCQHETTLHDLLNTTLRVSHGDDLKSSRDLLSARGSGSLETGTRP